MKWREFGTAVEYVSFLTSVRGICGMVLALMGFGQAVTDNASVNIVAAGALLLRTCCSYPKHESRQPGCCPLYAMLTPLPSVAPV